MVVRRRKRYDPALHSIVKGEVYVPYPKERRRGAHLPFQGPATRRYQFGDRGTCVCEPLAQGRT